MYALNLPLDKLILSIMYCPSIIVLEHAFKLVY
jgi:hypothetical protein